MELIWSDKKRKNLCGKGNRFPENRTAKTKKQTFEIEKMAVKSGELQNSPRCIAEFSNLLPIRGNTVFTGGLNSRNPPYRRKLGRA